MIVQEETGDLVSKIGVEYMNTGHTSNAPNSSERNDQEKHGNQEAQGQREEKNITDNASLGPNMYVADPMVDTSNAVSGSDSDYPPATVLSAKTGQENESRKLLGRHLEQNTAEILALRQQMPVTIPTADTVNHVSGRVAERNEVKPTVSTQTSTDTKLFPTNQDEPPNKKKCLEEINHLHIKFDNFEVLDKIGEGGFGEVFRGVYLGTPVAVKKLKVKRLKLVKQSLLKEVQVHSHIRHPNIVLLMGYSIEADYLYLLTELIQGPNLDDVLFGEQGHKLVLPQKHNIAKQVCQAIAYLHNRSPIIIHRDIKPENVLLSKNYEIAKVCDMGLSKMKLMNTMHSTLVQKTDMQPGTPAYQAPEVLVNLLTAKTPSDVWSLCCTYVELYTERTVWNLEAAFSDSANEGDDSVKVLTGFMERKEIPHGLVHLATEQNVPHDVKQVITEGLQYEISMRPTALKICSILSEN